MERFPLPLGAWDVLRYFIVALPEPSINYFDIFQQISDVFKIIEICLFVYNVYFLCRHMKVNLVRHFICLKIKMTEFRVGCFHRQMKETYFKGVK